MRRVFNLAGTLVLACAWLWLAHPVSALGAEPHVTVLPNPGGSYDSHVSGVENVQARAEVAKAFYASHGDAYDFLVVLPAFPANLGADTAGLHLGVRNPVQGIGHNVYDRGAQFGSAARLKGYIDMGALMSGHPSISVEEAVGVLAHEVAHQWSGRAKYRDPVTWETRGDLLGRDGGHWSFFLDSDASVLYGSDWQARTPGTYESTRSGYTPGAGRFSDLDLYLMGLLSPEEVPAPFVLLRPGMGVSYAATDLPPADTTVINATPSLVSLQDVIAAMGPRVPAASGSQRSFRAAFVLLTAAGQPATSEQLQFVEDVRRAFGTRFFFLTRGQGVLTTELEEVPAGDGPLAAPLAQGLGYLLARQKADGSWAERPETLPRDTQAALEALSKLGLDPSVVAASGRGGAFLGAASNVVGVDGAARRLLGLVAAHQPVASIEAAAAALRAQADLAPGQGVGLVRGYAPTLIDSMLAGRALRASGASAAELAALRDAVLAKQGEDGGWAFLAGGPSRLESTALALQWLAEVEASPAMGAAVAEATAFLASLRRPDGTYGDERPSAAGTAQALRALLAWGTLSVPEAQQTVTALRKSQRGDGSWEGSVFATARALEALREAEAPNLTVGPVFLSATEVVEGASLLATVTVRNTGLVDAVDVPVRAATLDGVPLGATVTVPFVGAGKTVVVAVPVDTQGHGGVEQIALVIDPDGDVDETREDDNGAVVNLAILPPPAQPDLLVVAGSLTSEPLVIGRVPSLLRVHAVIRNAGLANTTSVPVSLRINGAAAGSTTVSVAGRAQVAVSLEGTVTSAPLAGVPVSIEVDPGNVVAEANDANNTASAVVPVQSAIDVAVAALAVTPTTVNQGSDVTLTFNLENHGTVEASPTQVEVTIETAGGVPVATLPPQTVAIPANNSAAPLTRTLKWRANTSGSLVAKVRAVPGHPTLVDSHLADNVATAAFSVTASSYANLLVPSGTLTVSPLRPLQGTSATASVEVRNGGASAAGPFQVEFFLGDPQASGARFSLQPVASLAAGAAVMLTAPFDVEAAGATSVTVVVDSGNAVTEFDDEDNTAVLSIEPVPYADLAVASGDIQPGSLFPRAGAEVPVTVTFRNTGGQTAEAVRVALYQGAPESGGTLIGAEQVVAQVAPGAEAQATFTWPTEGLKGEQRLVAVLNAARTVTENDHANNRAERVIRVQDASLALSHPYFSPNGDGVRDTTEVTYRLESAVPVEVTVADPSGEVVRTLAAQTVDLGGFITWDGRDEEARVVPDGSYRLTVRAGTAQARSEVGTLLAVVDNNRLPLGEETPAQLVMDEPFDFRPDANFHRRGTVAFAPDDTGMYFIGERKTPDAQSVCSFYFQSIDGGSPRRVASREWSHCDELGSDVSISPDGKTLAFVGLIDAGACTSSSCRQVRLYDLETEALQTLTVSTVDGIIRTDAPVFSPDGKRVLYQVSAGLGPALVVRDIAGGFRRVLKDQRVCPTTRCGTEWTSYYEVPEIIEQAAFSPDGQTVALLLRWNPNRSYERRWAGLYSVNVEAGAPVAITDDLNQYKYGNTLTRWGTGAAWLPGARGLAYVADGVRLWSPGQGAGSVLHEAPYDAGLIEGMAMVASGPSGRNVFHAFSPGLAGPPRHVWRLPVGGGPLTSFYAPQGQVFDARWSPRGTFLTAFVAPDDTAAPGGYLRVTTAENLGVRLSASRTPGSPFLTLKGTAADLNFESYELTARLLPGGVERTVIARSTQPVLNGTLAEWAPAVPGLYELTLTARDRAGNVRTRSTKAVWTTLPALANLWREPEFISPNGDLVQDSSLVTYTTTEPLSAQFEFVSSAGAVVRRISRTHAETGTYSFTWDGRNDLGEYVADDSYRLQTVGGTLSFVVDRTKPEPEFAYAGTVPAPTGSEPQVLLLPTAVFVEPAHYKTEVPALAVMASWRAQDAHLAGWELERGPLPGEQGFTVLESGTKPVMESQFVWLRKLRGRPVRLRAWDKAGNAWASEPSPAPEYLQILALGPAELLEAAPGSLVLDGRELPRIDVLTPVVRDGVETAFTFAPQRYAFAFEASTAKPLVEFAVTYAPISGGDIVRDTSHVSLRGDSVVLWDARKVAPGEYYVRVEARDTDGRLFSSVIQMRAPNHNKVVELKRCVQPSSGLERTLVQLVFHNMSLTTPAPGGTVSFFRQGASTPEKRFPFEGFTADSQGGVDTYELRLDTSVLAQCAYTMVFEGRTIGGLEVRGEEKVDLCGAFVEHAQVSGSRATLQLSETFRKPVESMEVFLKAPSASSWKPVGTVGAIQSLSYVSIPLGSENACGTQSVRLLTHFADGTVADTLEQTQAGTCMKHEFGVQCTVAKVGNPARVGTASACSTQPSPEFTVSLSAQSSDGREVQELSAFLQPMSGGAPLPLLLGAHTSGESVSTSANIATKGLPEGRYQVGLQARDSLGYVASAVSDIKHPLIVDHQIPIVSLSAPAQDAVVCPVLTRDAGGVARPSIQVKGTISDTSLERYAVWLAPHGQALVSRIEGTPADLKPGVLGSIDAATLTAGLYDLKVSAWDSSGDSACTSPVTFRYVTGITLGGVGAEGLFSPNGDGTADTAFFSTMLSEAADTATLAVIPVVAGVEGTSLGNAFSGALGSGARTLSWDGLNPGTGAPASDGEYVLRLSVRDACGKEATHSGRVVLDTVKPTVAITSPSAGATIGGALAVYGEARDLHFAEYTLEVAPASTSNFTLVSTATAPVTGVLGVLDTAQLAPGNYTLRLTASDRAGNSDTRSVAVTVSGRGVLGGLRLAHSLLSPDSGDTVGDETQAYFKLKAQAAVTLEVLNLSGQVEGTVLSSVVLDATAAGVEHSATLGASVLDGLPDGPYRVRITAVSTATSTTEVDEVPLTLDREKPALSFVTPHQGGDVRGAVQVVGTISDLHLRSWRLLHAQPEALEEVVTGGGSPREGVLATLPVLAEGEHTLALEAEDAAGNTRRHAITFRADTTAPRVAFASPLQGSWLSGRKLPVHLSAQLTEAHPKQVTLSLVRGGVPQTLASVATLPADGVLMTWSTPTQVPADGPATLVLATEDAAGNTGESQLAVAFDSTEPVAHIESPRDELAQSSIVIHGTAADDNLALYTLELSDGEPGVASRFVPLASGTTSVQSGTLATLDSVPADGTYTLRLTVRDLAGNETVSLSGFRVDTVPPPAPTALVATVQRPDDVRLSWAADSSADVAGYRILRAKGDAPLAELPISLVVGNTYTDSDLSDGTWRYAVAAVDAAGLRSEPSSEARAVIDSMAPVASLSTPRANARVTGLVELRGTAYSPDDFREYRLSRKREDGAVSQPFETLATSSAPVQGGVLGFWDTSGLEPDSVWTLRLEAEDLVGNIAESVVMVTVDNVAPAAPVFSSVTASGASVALTWSAGGSDADLAGFLLLRNGAIANGPEGVSISDFGPYLLAPETTSFTDADLPDGVYTYQLLAVDTAGHLSAPAVSAPMTIETRVPKAVVTSPVALSRLTGPVWVHASASDEDIVSVQLEVRAAGAAAFTALTPVSTRYPYAVQLDPAALGASVLELRAVATDAHGNSDPAPESVFVFFDTSLTPPTAVAQVDGSSVTVSWTDGNPPAGVWGYDVRRAGVALTGARALPTVTASSVDTAAGSSAAYGYDGNTGTAWTSASGLPRAWELGFGAVPLTNLTANVTANALVRVLVQVKDAWVLVSAPVRATSGSISVALPELWRATGVRLVFLETPTGSASVSEAMLTPGALAATSPVVETSVPEGLHTYEVAVVGPTGQRESVTATARVYRPVLESLSSGLQTASRQLKGSNVEPGATVRVLRNGSELTSVLADAEGRFSANITLIDGLNTLSVRAEDSAGNRSLPSAEQFILWSSFKVAVALAPPTVTGSNVSLSFTVTSTGSPLSSLKNLDLWRSLDGGAPELAAVLPGSASGSYVATNLRNGTYSFTLTPRSTGDVLGPTSEPVSATVNVPALGAPEGLVVRPVKAGRALIATWTHPATPSGFRVERAESAAGPFTALRSGALVSGRSVSDAGLVNGKTYFYRVVAVDAAGNASAPSGVASGVPVDTRAPTAPHFTTPTAPGTPYVSATVSTTVGGLAEPASLVSLLRDGLAVGHARAGDSVQVLVGPQVTLSRSGLVGTPVLSPNGRTLAYAYGDGSHLVVEDLETHTVLAETSGSGLSFSNPAFSPDGASLAVEVKASNVTSIHMVDVATGSRQALVTSPLGEQFAPSWSADSLKLAYESLAGGVRSIVVTSLDDRIEHPVTAAGQNASAPRWLSDGRHLLALLKKVDGATALTRLDTQGTEPSAELFSAFIVTTPYAVSEDWNVVALGVLASGGPPKLVLVDLTSAEATQVAVINSLMSVHEFGADGRSLLYLREGVLYRYDFDTAASTSVVSSFSGTRFLPSASGRLLSLSGSTLNEVRAGASFSLPGVSLSPGDNLFTATASDGASLESTPSRAIEVRYSGPMADLGVSAVLQPATPVSSEPATALVTVSNLGAAGTVTAPVVVVTVLGSDGSLRPAPAVRLKQPLAAGASALLAVAVDVRGLLGPGQQLKVAVDPGREVTEASRSNNEVLLPFSVAASRDTGLLLTTTRSRYPHGEVAVVRAAVSNRASGLLEGARYELAVVDAAGREVFGATQPLPLIPPGFTHELALSVPTESLVPGDYVARASVMLGTEKLADALAPFAVDGRAVLQGLVAVNGVSGAPVSLQAGSDAVVAFQVRNGGTVEEPSLGLRLVVSEPVTHAVLAQHSLSAETLAGGQSRSGEHTFTTASWSQGAYAVSLVAELAGGEQRLLSSTRLDVIDGAPPQLQVLNLTDGMFVRGTVQVRVRATDGAPGVAFVRARVGLGADVSLTSVGGNAVDDEWVGTLTLPAEGPHVIHVSASDRVGNAAPEVSVTVVRDTVAPVLSLGGLVDGALVGLPVEASLTVTDANPGTHRLLLDGVQIAPGTVIAVDGEHSLFAEATDKAGNTGWKQVSFTLDTKAPEIFFGVVDGSHLAADTTPTIQVMDPHLASVTVTLNGLSYIPGTPIAVEGVYTLHVVARDALNHEATATATFTLDKTKPVVTMVQDLLLGRSLKDGVVLEAQAQDAHLLFLTETLDGVPYVPGSLIETDGVHTYRARAVDRAGNEAVVTRTFTIDRTPPEIQVVGATDGSFVSAEVTLSATATDALTGATVIGQTVNDEPYDVGTPLVLDDTYVYVVTAVDGAGNIATRTVTFTIDTRPPLLGVTGMWNGAVLGQPLTPVPYAQERNPPVTYVETLDGQPFPSGGTISVDGVHTYVVVATDRAGNSATKSYTFTLDTQAPVITVTGVSENEVLETSTLVGVSVSDLTSVTTTVTLNGSAVSVPVLVSSNGSYTLVVQSKDVLDHVATKTVNFTVDLQSPSSAGDAEPPARVLALVRAGACAASESEEARVRDFLTQALAAREGRVEVVTDDAHFLREVHGGEYNVYLSVDLADASAACSEEESRSVLAREEPSEARKAWARDVTDRVQGGRAGFVAIRARADELPLLRELLGIEFERPTAESSATLVTAEGAVMALRGASEAYARLKLSGDEAGVAVTARYGEATGWTDAASVERRFGRGLSATFGFDLSRVLSPSEAASTLRRAVERVTPARPSGSLGVKRKGERSAAPGAMDRAPDAYRTLEVKTWALAAELRGETGQAARAAVEAALTGVRRRSARSATAVESNVADLFGALSSVNALDGDHGELRSALDELIRYWEARWFLY
ncbi:CARDB domain-containing protein [Myxococcaceae bacterium GXIMD 01537]